MSRRNRNRYGGRDEPNADGWFEGDMQLVLRIDGVKGACEHAGFEGWIEVMSCSHNLARQVQPSERPLRIRQAAALRKKRAYIAAGLDQNGSPLPEPEPKKAEDGTVIPPTAAELEARPSGDDYALNQEAALVDYDSDADLDFRDDEVPARKLERPYLGEFTLTKFTDIASPQLMSMLLSQKEFTAQIAFVQARAKKVEPTPKDDSASSSSAAAEENKEDKDDKEKEEEEEPEIPREYVATQEYSLGGCVMSNISMSGGSGGKPVETLSINLGKFAYRFVDWHAKREKDAPVAEGKVAYDHLRSKVETS